MAAVCDTLEAAKHLQDAGIERDQAEAIVKVMHKGQGELATKAHIDQLEKRITTDINWLKFLAGAQITTVVLATIIIINVLS